MPYRLALATASALALALSVQGQALGQLSVELAAVESGRLEQTTVLPGELRPYQDVNLRAKVVGFVERIAVDRGSRVGKGDLIAELSAPELDARTAEAEAELTATEASLAEAEARLAASASTYERLQKAAETPGVVAGNDLLRAEKTAEADRARVNAFSRRVDASRAELAAVRQMMDYLEVTAPFEGIITERRVHVGTLVGPASNDDYLVRLEQVGRLRLVTPIPESFAASVAEDTELSFSVSAHPGETFSAIVSRSARSVSTETRTMAVEADVDNRDGRLAPGMYAEVTWTARRVKDSLFVPRTAVVETTERLFVIRVRDGRAEWVDVRRGGAQGDRVEVVGDLSPGDPVVLRATDEIRPGVSIASP